MAQRALVVDLGSSTYRAGLAGAQDATLHVPACIGQQIGHPVLPQDDVVSAGPVIGVGVRSSRRGLLKLQYALDRGIVDEDATPFSLLIGEAVAQTAIAPSEQPILLTKPVLQPDRDILRSAELLFESHNFARVVFATAPSLALLASGLTTGLVVDVGGGLTQAEAIVEGIRVPGAIERASLGGLDVDHQLQLLLRRRQALSSSRNDRELARDAKEAFSFVAPSIEEAKARHSDSRMRCQYALPDGEVIDVCEERYQPSEVLFSPSLFGCEAPAVHEVAARAYRSVPRDLRRAVGDNLLVCGGVTATPLFSTRFLSEFIECVPAGVECTLHSTRRHELASWVGGSTLGSLPMFKKLGITKGQFEEDPNSLLLSTFRGM